MSYSVKNPFVHCATKVDCQDSKCALPLPNDCWDRLQLTPGILDECMNIHWVTFCRVKKEAMSEAG